MGDPLLFFHSCCSIHNKRFARTNYLPTITQICGININYKKILFRSGNVNKDLRKQKARSVILRLKVGAGGKLEIYHLLHFA